MSYRAVNSESKLKSMQKIRIRTILGSWIRIRIKVKVRITLKIQEWYRLKMEPWRAVDADNAGVEGL
jgi:hypothetical protein